MNSTNKISILYLQLSNPKTKTLGGSFYSLLNMVTGLDKRKYNLTAASYYQNHIMGKMSHMGITTTILPYYRNIFMESNIVHLLKRLSKKNDNKFNSTENGDFIEKKKRTPVIVLKLLRDYLLSFRNAIPIKKIIKKGAFDIIHTNSGLTVDRAGILVGIWTKKKIVCHLRNMPDYFFPIFDRFLAKHVDTFIAVSEAVKSHYQKRLGIPSEKIVTIYNSVMFDDINALDILPKTNSLSLGSEHKQEAYKACIMGRLVWWKGHREFLLAAQQVLESGKLIHFYIVGDGPIRRKIMQLTEELGMAEHVTFTGYRNDAMKFLAKMDLVVCPSVKPEPLGRIILEAMALGKPVIATNQGGSVELIKNGETGFLVDPGKPEQIKEIILKLSTDRELGKRIGESGRHFAEEHFKNEVMTKKLEDVYNTLFS